MDAVDALEQAWSTGAKLVTGLSERELSNVTPCENWDVAALVNHMLAECEMMTVVNRGEPASSRHRDFVSDGRDLLATWETAGRDNVLSWRESGLHGDRTYFYGTFPAPVAAVINLGEVVVHSWDLAKATGQGAVVAPELAALVYGLYSAAPLDGMRAAGQLGPEVEVPVDAPIAHRMLGLLGRRP